VPLIDRAEDEARPTELQEERTMASELQGQDHPVSGEVWGRRPLEGKLRDALTDRETRILYYLPTNLSAPEIAGQLSVSVNTIRTHMRHVYEKLDAHRRTDAVERARALGLLAPFPRRP
jgi:ATP/maltotriose-dependent transcriptional regulator MalT